MKKFLKIALLSLTLAACKPEPPLHLFDAGNIELELPMVELELEAYWDYELAYGVTYDWRAEWFYGWDETDKKIFGEIGYTEPSVFNLRRYYTGNQSPAHHNTVLSNTINGYTFRGQYTWGFWDILVWNDVNTIDGVQSLNFDETTTLDSVTAYTNQTMRTSRHNAPNYTRSFYEPEPLFSAYDVGVEINRSLEGFYYDEERDVWVKRLDMILKPVTYIYLTQVILHNNKNKIIGVDGSADLSGMARTVTLNSGLSGSDAVTVYYNNRLKNNCDMNTEKVDIVGGRLTTFGICNQNGNNISRLEEVMDQNRHYMDVTMQFNNGMDSTFVFDVTDQVRRRWKGGVLTVELDMDTIPVPTRSGGSAFNAVVKDYEDGGTHEFEM